MKRANFLIIYFLIFSPVFAQTHVEVKTDSVKVVNGELVVQNATQNVQGFLFNNGNGVTSFKNGVIKIDDTSYLIGGDTLHINSTETNYKVGVFYVAKKYTSPGAAVFSGLLSVNVSSTNTSYNTQLTNAKMGNLQKCYPDPFSARNAALDSIAGGAIAKALIIVLADNSYYVGSSTLTQNGTYTGLTTSNSTPDIEFSSSNSTTVSSLWQNKVDYYFEAGSGLIYINKSFNIYLGYQVNSGDSAFESHIWGRGFFKQYFGEPQGFIAALCLVDNARAIVTLEADEVWSQQWQAFTTFNHKILTIKIKKLFSSDSNVFYILGSDRNGDGLESIMNVEIEYQIHGNSTYPTGSPTDWWQLITIYANSDQPSPSTGSYSGLSSSRKKIFNFSWNQLTYNAAQDGGFFSAVGLGAYNNCDFNISINNFTTSLTSSGSRGLGTGIIKFSTAGAITKNNFNFYINNYRGTAKLLGTINLSHDTSSANNIVTLNCNDAVREAGANATNGLLCLGNTDVGVHGQGAKVYIDIKKAEENFSEIISFTGAPVNFYTVSGYYANTGTSVPFESGGTTGTMNIFFKDFTMVARNPTITAPFYNTAMTFYTQNVAFNKSAGSNNVFSGDTPVIISALSSF